MMETVLFIIELIGTAAFAVSGAFVAIEKKMDIFGVAMLGLTTAVGGGVIRDVILGAVPPAMFASPVYAVLAIICAAAVFVPAVRRLLQKRRRLYDTVLLVMDSAGLGIFSAVGVRAAVDAGFGENLFLQVFVGVMTGVGGGILRDVMAGVTPYVFAKHFYACASLCGALAAAILHKPLGMVGAMCIGAALTFVLRLCAAKWRWSLPRA